MAPSNGWAGALRSVTAGGAVCRLMACRVQSSDLTQSVRPTTYSSSSFAQKREYSSRNASVSNDFIRSKNSTPFRWSFSCWTTRAGKLFELHVDGLAVAIEAPHAHAAVARHLAADIRDAQAAFPVLDEIAADGGDLGVHDRRCGTISVSPVRGSFFSMPATKIRTLSCTCGAARPMP